MTIPTGYDHGALAAYMHELLGGDSAGGIARTLKWSPVSDYDEAVAETALALGVDDVAEVTGRDETRRLRAVARRELWRLVMQRTAHLVDASTEGGGQDHSQIWQHAQAMYESAAAEAERVIAEVDAAKATPARPLFFTRAPGGRA